MPRKIGILTFQHAENSGASLQAYALQEFLKSKYTMFEFEHINYSNVVINKKSKVLGQNNKRQMAKLLIKKIVYFNRIKRRTARFNKFDRENLKLTELFTDKTVASLASVYDAIIVGSDQVFNTEITGFDSTYLLDFADSKTKRFAYAASFGDASLFDMNKPYFTPKLSDFDGIALRERDAKVTVSKQLPDKNISISLDPTLLMTKDFWESRFPEVAQKTISEPYLLVYSINPSERLMSFAVNEGKKSGLLVVYLNTGLKKVNGVHNVFDFGPIEFLNFIRNAEKVVVASFHGLAFSIIFQKQVAVEFFDKKSNGSERLKSLLNGLLITNRNISEPQNPFLELIDYKRVDSQLDKLKEESEELIDGWMSNLGNSRGELARYE